MQFELTDIENILKEHEAINAHMKAISTLAEDRKLEEWENSANLTSEQLQILNNKWHNIQQTFNYLEEGIMRHTDHEDRILNVLFGNLILNR